MKLLNKLERKFGRYAIPNLMMYIVFTTAVVFIFNLISGNLFTSQLYLNPQLVLEGQVWRLVTFIFIPGTSGIWIIFFLLFYYWIGTTLEREWGAFKFNVYYFTGMLLVIIASFLFGTSGTVTYLNMTLFLAFATIYPNYTIRIYMILPVKVKYIAWLDVAFLLFNFIVGPSWGIRFTILASVANYLLFFGKDLILGRQKRVVNHTRKSSYQKKVDKAQKSFNHKCTVCGRTEVDNPNLEFRYCSKCDGLYEYCDDHLKDHEHIHNSN